MDITGAGEVADLLKDGIDKIWPDKTELQKAQLSALLSQAQAQTNINQAEATQPGIHFRDGAGWVCVAAFALMALKTPIEWVCTLIGHPVQLPTFDSSMTTDMLFGLLGLGTMHTYQTIKGS